MKFFNNIINGLLLVAVAGMTTACRNAFFDEDNCDATYRLHLKYTRNMKWADAFPAEVTHVGVYAFEEGGKLAWSGSETVERLSQDGYFFTVPVDPGKYDFVVWCGGKSLEESAHAWTLGAGNEISTKSDLHICLDAPQNPDGEGLLANSDIHRLYHGSLSNVELPSVTGIYDYEVDLTKDTNFIRVVLQHADGEPVNPDHFNFTITDTNAALDHTNLSSSPTPVTYRPWAITAAETELPDPDNIPDSSTGSTDYKTPSSGGGRGSSRGITQISSVVADMTTSRLIKGNRPTIKIDCTEPGNEHNVAKLDLISYFLMIKGSANRHVEDQDFLDRQDDYTMMLILDDNNRWSISLGLYINSWRIVEQSTTL